MSNDDIVMANYSMLLEVYFLFMDINLSLSGISLALLCERRDLQGETCRWVLWGEDLRAIGTAFHLSLRKHTRGLFLVLFCSLLLQISHESLPQIEGILCTALIPGSSSKSSLDSCHSSLGSWELSWRDDSTHPIPHLTPWRCSFIILHFHGVVHLRGCRENWAFSFFDEWAKI